MRVLRNGFYLLIAWLPVWCSPALPAERCEYASVLGDAFTPPQNRMGEFRIALSPPDSRSVVAVQSHSAFATIFANLVRAETAARTRGFCNSVISTSLFPDLRVYLIANHSRGEIDSDPEYCRRVSDGILQTFQPTRKSIVEAASIEADGRLRRMSSPAAAMIDADNILTNALGHIYEADTIMHALVSVNDQTFRSADPNEFLAWLGAQRSRQKTELQPLKICQAEPNVQELLTDSNGGRLPYSRIRPPGHIKLSTKPGGPAVARVLRRVLIVGGGHVIPNSTFSTPATDKYCNREHEFVTDGAWPPDIGPKALIRCLKTVMQNSDMWIVFFCDPDDCRADRAAETIVEALAVDPDVIALAVGSAEQGQPRGPYQVTFEPGVE
jgi:hypothetical protein